MDERERLKELILSDYEKGFPITYISFVHGITDKTILIILKEYKQECSLKNGLKTEFKEMIAKRDSYDGITRVSMSKELGVNANTIKKACEKFGKALKDNSGNGQEYTRIDGDFFNSVCPSCNSLKMNKVDKDTFFCKKCGDEYIFKDGYILKVNFEFFEE